MQTPKPRAGTLEVPQRTSSATSRTARQLKTPGSETDSTSSQPACRTPKDRSPKVTDRKSPRSPISERKRPSKISELETQLAQLQEDLKKTKDQLGSSESSKKHAQQEVEEIKKQLITLAEKHSESQRQLLELSASEEDRLQELCKLSQERDKAWESEIEAVKNQHSAESTALSSALNEIQRLKIQLETVADSEAVQTKDAESLQLDLAHTHSIIENLKIELTQCKKSEAQAQSMAGDTLRQLETARATMETLRADGIKTMEAYNSLSLELEKSRARVYQLEELVSELQMNLTIAGCTRSTHTDTDKDKDKESSEAEDLRSLLEAMEMKYQEEQIQSTMKIRSAYELVEQLKFNSKEAEFESELKRTKAHIEELKANLMDKETELQSISEENESLSTKIEMDLKASMMENETKLKIVHEENEILKSEIKKRETETENITEEAEKISKRAERATEQLEAAQVANSEMEAELRRLKVQSDQWRKAAEAAAAVLSAGNNNTKCMDRSGSFDGNYPMGGKICSPYSEDMDDDSPKKKNVLKKLGSLWKKGQK